MGVLPAAEIAPAAIKALNLRKKENEMSIKKFLFKSASVAMSAVILSSGIGAFAAEKDDFTITNPYQNINWSTVNQYKTALHTHTNASDGDITLKESLERHNETGFDIVAVTDHGTVDYSWVDNNGRNLMGKVLELVGRSEGDVEYLGESGTWDNGVSYSMETRGDTDYLITDNGREIMRIPYGIENNAVSVNAHVNSWFADFSRNLPSDYRDAVAGVDAAGGLSVINHPGEYTQARYELYQEDAYDLSNPSYKYYIEKFYGLINEFDSCLGIDINSKGDDRTRYDRKLWDIMLTKAAEKGKTVYAIASSDAHQLNKIDTGSTVILASEKNVSAVRSALENGEFFAQSTCISNCDELEQIAAGIKTYYGETELYKEIASIVDAYKAKREEIEKSSDDGNVGVKYTALDDEGYIATDTRPEIKSVIVDDTQNTISIDSDNALIVRWISDGKLIATTSATDGEIDLDDYADELGGYVRAEVFGEGGVVYTQSFTLNADKAYDSPSFFTDYGFFDFLFSLVDRYVGLLVRIVKNVF